MHPSAYEYTRTALARHFDGPYRPRVLELGSYNVNGSARGLIPRADWWGIDIRPGYEVDEVADAATYQPDTDYDLVISTEAFEHMEHVDEAINTAWEALKPGGILIATMAAPERHPHNNDGDHDAFAPGEHYAGVHPEQLLGWLEDWDILDIEHRPDIGDLYVTARTRAPERL